MEISYEQAVTELDSILKNIQSENCDIDKLASMTKRATTLLSACREKLIATEDELKQILASLEEA